ncbi:MAG: hypothetical protein R3D90_02610 [Paracoccaceae bacterium]
MSGNLREWVHRRRVDGLPTERALQHPFFDTHLEEVRIMPRRKLVQDLRLVPKVGEKSYQVILAALGDL